MWNWLESGEMSVNENVVGDYDEETATHVAPLLQCSVCKTQSFPERHEDPWMMPCCHTICHRCCEEWEGDGRGKCGVCSRPFSKENLVRNPLSRQLFGPSKTTAANLLKKVCTNCYPEGSGFACCYCVNCRVWYCADCLEAHASLREFNGHVLQQIEEAVSELKLEGCPVHNDLLATEFCKSCNRLVCAECLFGVGKAEHEGHSVIDVAGAGENNDAEIGALMDDLSAARRDLTNQLAHLEKLRDSVDEDLSEVQHALSKALIQLAVEMRTAADRMQESMEGDILTMRETFSTEKRKTVASLDAVLTTLVVAKCYRERGSRLTKIRMESWIGPLLRRNFEANDKSLPAAMRNPLDISYEIGKINVVVSNALSKLGAFHCEALNTVVNLCAPIRASVSGGSRSKPGDGKSLSAVPVLAGGSQVVGVGNASPSMSHAVVDAFGQTANILAGRESSATATLVRLPPQIGTVGSVGRSVGVQTEPLAQFAAVGPSPTGEEIVVVRAGDTTTAAASVSLSGTKRAMKDNDPRHTVLSSPAGAVGQSSISEKKIRGSVIYSD